MKTIASLFSGGSGVEIGAKAAGLKPIWGVEIDPEIAAIYAANIRHQPIVKSVTAVDPKKLERPDVLWTSPPCQPFSVARSKKLLESADAALGYSVIPFLEILQPSAFILENVEAYRKSKPFHAIVDALHRLGYWTNWSVLNFADYAVPQTRRRLILQAIKGCFVPPLPARSKWQGWYEAIADLIPTLPESEFAPWQLNRMPELSSTSLVEGVHTIRKCTVRPSYEPSPCVTAHWMHRPVTIPRAFIVDGKNIHQGALLTIRSATEPHFSVIATHLDRPSHAPKAFIIDGQNSGTDSLKGERGLTQKQQDEPKSTITTTAELKPARAWLEQGRVVVMTPRALARFQSFPDTYQLPDSRTLACKVVGNAVPPLLAEKLLLSMQQNF